MKKYLTISILFLALNCRSSQIRDQTVIDNNNQLIEEVKDTKSTVDNLNISDKDKSKLKNTLSKCGEYSKNSNNSIYNCNIRESELKKDINNLQIKNSFQFKVILGEVFIIFILLLYIRYFKR